MAGRKEKEPRFAAANSNHINHLLPGTKHFEIVRELVHVTNVLLTNSVWFLQREKKKKKIV